MELVNPSLTYKDSFIGAVEEYHREGRYTEYAVADLRRDFASVIAAIRRQEQGEGLPEGYVPQTTYWLVDDDAFIGRVSIRHRLTEALLREGGHIGYDIRPTRRRQGYGTRILALALPHARNLDIERVLVGEDTSSATLEVHGFPKAICLSATIRTRATPSSSKCFATSAWRRKRERGSPTLSGHGAILDSVCRGSMSARSGTNSRWNFAPCIS